MRVVVVIETDWTQDQVENWLRQVVNDANDTSYRGFGFKPPIKSVAVTDDESFACDESVISFGVEKVQYVSFPL